MIRSTDIDRLATGIAGLDAVLGGGLPRRSVTIVSGPPGSGKTILAQQLCFQNARAGRPAIYFRTLSEPTAKTLQHLAQFSFADAKRIGRDVHFVDLGVILRSHGLAAAAALIVEHLKKFKPGFVVIDSFKVFDDLSQSKEELRKFGYEVAISLLAWEVTGLLLGEYGSADLDNNPVFSIVDGIIHLTQRETLGEHVRYLKVIKMRGTRHSRDDHAFSISRSGITLFPPKVAILRHHALRMPPGRCQTGITKLDELLGPGIPWGSSVLLSGVAGTGKTVLALEFLHRGARAGQKGIFFSFEETIERLLACGLSMGWDLKRDIDRGMIEIVFIPQPEIMVEEHLLMIRNRIAALKARRVVLDSLSVFLHKVTEPQIVREKVFHLCTIIENSRAVGLFSTDIPYGSTQLGRWGVEETVVDGVVILSFTEEEHERQRYIEIYKLRNTAHLKGRHNMIIEPGGITVFPRYGLEAHPEIEPPPLDRTRLPSGVPGLDGLMGGGLLRRSVTLVSGSAGAGKSTLALQFLLEGARRGEPGLYVTTEEGPEQLFASAAAFGLPLKAAVKKGLIRIHWVTRARLRTEQLLTVIADLLTAMKAKRVVLDASPHMVGDDGEPDDLGLMLQQLVVRWKTLRVTGLVALEAHQLLPGNMRSERNLSPIADNVLLLRYRDTGTGLVATLTVVKTRGSASKRQTCIITAGKGGMRVSPAEAR